MAGRHASDGFDNGASAAVDPADTVQLYATEGRRTALFDGSNHPQGDGWADAARIYEPDDRPAWRRTQLWLAMHYLEQRGHLPGAPQRAAAILMADAEAPMLERALGALVATIDGEPVAGLVHCRNCGRHWDACTEDPYFDAVDPATLADGLCGGCVMTLARTEDAVPVLTGPVVSAEFAAQTDAFMDANDGLMRALATDTPPDTPEATPDGN